MRWWLGAAGPRRNCGPAAPLWHLVGRPLNFTVRHQRPAFY